MSTVSQPPRPPMPSRQREPLGNRPLPKGIVAIAHNQPAPSPAVTDNVPEGTLIVGQDIQVKGQIDDCRALVVEGRVEATLKTDHLEVRKGGTFVGAAEVGRAIIAGTFEGTLSVSGQLDVTANGLIRGETRYTRIMIEEGGIIIGTVDRTDGTDIERQRPSLADTGS